MWESCKVTSVDRINGIININGLPEPVYCFWNPRKNKWCKSTRKAKKWYRYKK